MCSKGMVKLEKIDRIKKEVDKLNKIFKDLDPLKKKVAEHLIQNAAFLVITLQDLQHEVNTNGVTEHFVNGKQDFIREGTALKAYNTTIKNYNTVVKQLLDLLSKDSAREAKDELLNFIAG